MIIHSNSEHETKKIGKAIAGRVSAGDIICLFGELGSGKTVLVKGITRGLGGDESDVTSSSFVLMREYKTKKVPVYHFDLYRLEAARHIAALGYEEYFYGSGITVIEWAERLEHLLPQEHLKIEAGLGKKASQRCFRFSGAGKRYKKMAEGILEDIGY